MSGYEDYVSALRELDTVRNAQLDADQARRGRHGQLSNSMDALWERLSQQRRELSDLAADCSLPPVPSRSRPTPPPADPYAEVAAAAAEVDAAQSGYDESRYLAHRPALLPRWRADERNGLIYGGFAALSLIVQVFVLASAAGKPFGEQIGQVAICLLLPFAAWGAGWLTIGVVSRPVMGEPTSPGAKLPRNVPLGLVVCMSSWLVSCWLGNLYLN